MSLLEDLDCQYGISCVSKGIEDLLIVSDIVRKSRWYHSWPSTDAPSVDDWPSWALCC